MLKCGNTSLGIFSLLSICPSGGVEFLQMMKTPDTNCSNLLITSKEGLILLQGQDLEPRWTLEMQNISRLRTGNIFLSYIFLFYFLPFTFKHMFSLESNQVQKKTKSTGKSKNWGHVDTLLRKQGGPRKQRAEGMKSFELCAHLWRAWFRYPALMSWLLWHWSSGDYRWGLQPICCPQLPLASSVERSRCISVLASKSL